MKKLTNSIVKTKTNFNKISRDIHNFEKQAGFDKTSVSQLTKWLKEETENYKKAKTKIIKRNKILDIICLAIQISRREGMNLDDAWKRWWWKSKKYLKGK